MDRRLTKTMKMRQIFSEIMSVWAVLCTTVVTSALMLMFIFGGEFTFKVNWHTLADLLKKIKDP